MKKLLFFISLFIFFISPVSAETFSPGTVNCSSTKNLFNNTWYTGYRANYSSVGSPLVFQTRSNSEVSDYIKVDNNTNYTFSSNYSTRYTSGYIFITDSNFNYIGTTITLKSTVVDNLSEITFNTGNTGQYLTIYLAYNPNVTEDNSYLQIEEGTTKTSFTDWQDCSIITPTPTPDSNIYLSFLPLYLDRFSYLATGFTTNPYLFAMIGIIFAWIVLEILLHLIHIKGGYKK